MKDLTSAMDKQTTMLRLIVQKMEIRTEAENQDEGTTPDEMRNSRWSAVAAHYNKKGAMKKMRVPKNPEAIVSMWQSNLLAQKRPSTIRMRKSPDHGSRTDCRSHTTLRTNDTPRHSLPNV